MNVYFISGMCVNCKVFDCIELPPGFERKYMEWRVPAGNESLEEYARTLAEEIDSERLFMLVGYSLGGIVMQEMNKFMRPRRNILISSIKSKEEIPALFRIAKASHIPEYIPKELYVPHKNLSGLFIRLVYDMSVEEILRYVSCTSPEYMKWATCRITTWEPQVLCENLYHIHGTKDQIFPYRLIKDAYTIEGGDHLMVIKRADEVSRIFWEILLTE